MKNEHASHCFLEGCDGVVGVEPLAGVAGDASKRDKQRLVGALGLGTCGVDVVVDPKSAPRAFSSCKTSSSLVWLNPAWPSATSNEARRMLEKCFVFIMIQEVV